MKDKIIIDINYFYDENNKKVFDVENMTNAFNECIKDLECLEEHKIKDIYGNVYSYLCKNLEDAKECFKAENGQTAEMEIIEVNENKECLEK